MESLSKRRLDPEEIVKFIPSPQCLGRERRRSGRVSDLPKVTKQVSNVVSATVLFYFKGRDEGGGSFLP